MPNILFLFSFLLYDGHRAQGLPEGSGGGWGLRR